MDELRKILLETIESYEKDIKSLNIFLEKTNSYKKILEMSKKDLILYLYAFEFNNNSKLLEELVSSILPCFDNINITEFKLIIENLDTILNNKDIEELKTDNILDKNNILHSILEKMFTCNNIFSYKKFNEFKRFIDTENKQIFMSALYIILTYNDKNTKVKENRVNEYKNNAINIINFIIKDKKTIIKLYKDTYTNTLKILKKILKTSEDEIPINLTEYEKNNLKTTTNTLTILIIVEIYNNLLLANDYYKVKFINEELNNSGITKIDEILHKYNCKININNIKFSPTELEEILNDITNNLVTIKNNNNLLNKLINNIEYKYLKEILNLFKNNYITEKFIIDNIELLTNQESIIVFFKNINLLIENNINIKKVIKQDSNIIFDNNLINTIKTYKLYNINIEKDYYNYSFLKSDYSDEIDRFIEIGEYDLVKEDATLLNKNSSLIVKRCYLFKMINNPIVNENNIINGYLRNEEKFIIDDETLNDTIQENYQDFIPNNILKCLNSNNKTINTIFDLSCLEKYKKDDLSYVINNIIISKNKILKNLNILYLNKFNEKYSFEELLIYSIIYKYPLLIDKNILNNIKEKAKILK